MNDLLEILDTCDDEIPESGVDISLMPPVNANDDITDEDSGPEDNPNIDNLPASQLNSHAVVNQDITSVTNNIKNTVSETPIPGPSLRVSDSSSRAVKRRHVANRKQAIRNWKKNELPISETEWPLMYDVPVAKTKTPLQYFTQFFDRQVIDMITRFTSEYAAKRNKTGEITQEMITTFIGIILLSGYVIVPRRRMYWQNEKDTYNELVSNAMSRDKFDFIFSNFHVCNNDALNKNDRFAKVRPLLNEINDRFKNYAPHEQNHSVDESMVPYYGRHGCKQFIRGMITKQFYVITRNIFYTVFFIL